MFFVQSLHYGSKLSDEAKRVMERLRDIDKLDSEAKSHLQKMEQQIELMEELESTTSEQGENESSNSMVTILAERRLEWRALIAKVGSMVNQYNEIPSLLETFDRKYTEVLNWLQCVEGYQQQLENQQNIESLISGKEQLKVS